MTVQELIQQAQKLSVDERQQLMQALEVMADDPSSDIIGKQKMYRFSDLRGLGKEIWEGVDVEQYVNELRDEWDQRP